MESQQFAMFPRNDTHLTLQGLHRALDRRAVARCALPLKRAAHGFCNGSGSLAIVDAIWQLCCLTVLHAREKLEEWRTEYNEVRPHSATGDRTPISLFHQP